MKCPRDKNVWGIQKERVACHGRSERLQLESEAQKRESGWTKVARGEGGEGGRGTRAAAAMGGCDLITAGWSIWDKVLSGRQVWGWEVQRCAKNAAEGGLANHKTEGHLNL